MKFAGWGDVHIGQGSTFFLAPKALVGCGEARTASINEVVLRHAVGENSMQCLGVDQRQC
jgi:hypothetical protein